MTNSIQNSGNIQPKQNNENNFAKNTLGVVGGLGAGLALKIGAGRLLKPYYKFYNKNRDQFTPQEKKSLVQEANRMVETSGIKEKGFKGIQWVNTKTERFPGGISLKSIASKYQEEVRTAIKNKLKKVDLVEPDRPPKKMSKFKHKRILRRMENGCFSPTLNKVFTSKPSNVLHEIGHAINRNTNFLTRLPNNLSLISKKALIPLAVLTALFSSKPKKAGVEQTENKGIFEKTKDFVHNHIGLTVVGLSIPKLIEEATASAHAVKFVNASKKLSETVKNQHNKTLKIAYGTYLAGVAALASAASFAVFVKDKIAGNKTSK